MQTDKVFNRISYTYYLSLIDLILTLELVNKYGLDIEANPVGRWILSENWRIFIFKVVFVLCGLFVLWIFRERKLAQIASWIVLIAYSLLAVYHIIILIAIH